MPFKDIEKRRACGRASYHKHKERLRAYRKENQYKRHLSTYYGLTIEEYDKIKAKQNNACAICKRIDRRLFVDHKHENQKSRWGKSIRGLLCSKCNLLLGHACDSIEILKAAESYLLLYEQRDT